MVAAEPRKHAEGTRPSAQPAPEGALRDGAARAYNPVWSMLSTRTGGGAAGATVQRTCAACAEGGAPCSACEEAERPQAHGTAQLWRKLATRVPAAPALPGALQPSLRIGAPGDAYEREADSVADHVLRMPDPAPAAPAPVTAVTPHAPSGPPSVAHGPPAPVRPAGITPLRPGALAPLVRRDAHEGPEDDADTVQAKGYGAWALRRQLAPERPEGSGQPSIGLQGPGAAVLRREPTEEDEGDEASLQANAAGPPLFLRRQPSLDDDAEPDHTAHDHDPEDDAVQAQQARSPPLRRQAHEDADYAQLLQAAPIQRSAPSPSGPAGPGGVETYVRDLAGRGQPLPDAARRHFEPRFGYDFGRVRIHSDAAAAHSAAALNARAYAVGPHVVFGAGEFRPGSSEGQRLLAHELTHVVQQGQAEPTRSQPPAPSPPAGRGDAPPSTLARSALGARAPPPIARRDPGARSAVLRRSPAPKVGQEYMVQTAEGGNLLLRVQPDPARELRGAEHCKGAEKCPNSVGNVRSGTIVTVKEVRSYGWYVVEATTVESGARVGFVRDTYLKPVPATLPEGAYDEERGVCIDAGVCQAPAAGAAEELAPEESADTGAFEMGDAAFEAQEEGEAVEQYGVVQTDDGANLWPEPDPARKQPRVGLLTQNTKVFVERRLPGDWLSVSVDKHQRPGASTGVSQDAYGYVEAARVTTDLPDPDAWLHRITKEGQGALALALELYPDYEARCTLGVAACRDHRYLVNVLAAVNEAKGRRFLVKDNPGDGWDKARTKKATAGGGGKYSGGQIWVPGMDLVNALHGQVSSGSITLEALTTLADVAIGVAGFVVGLLHGALMSVADVFIGVVELIELVGKLVYKVFTGTLVADAKGLWDDISKISIGDVMDMLSAKWNHPSTWTRWHFRGYVIGYAIVELLMLFFTGGIVTAVKWAGKAGKFGKFAKYLSELPRVKKLLSTAEAMKGAGVDKMKAALKAAEALSEAHGWAARALRIPLGILRRLGELDIAKLKRLPQWARERFARLSEKAMLRVLGCHSPCKVDPDAIVAALKLAGTGGKKLDSIEDVLGVLKGLDSKLKTATISRKLRRPGSSLMVAIKEAGLTSTDFAKLADFLTPGDLTNPAQAYRTFVRYLTSVVPAKTGDDITKLNLIMEKMVASEVRRGSALKGAMFEQWVAMHVPALAGRTFGRIRFDLGKLIGKKSPPYSRPVDKWVPDKGEIWEMKHQLSKVPGGQADDYAALIGKVAPDGNTVKSVNYIFPTKAAAETNKHLATAYKFTVYYIDDVTKTMLKL